METSVQREETLRAARQAAEWLSTLENAGEQERQAFVQWLGRSALHVQEFLNLSAVDRHLDFIPTDYPLDVTGLRTRARTQVIPLSQPRLGEQQTFRRRRIWVAGAAAAVVAAVALGLWGIDAIGGQRYSTGVGEQRAIELEDGSLIHLNTRSAVAIRFSGNAREVRLLSGEALFKVKQNRARPFQVRAGETLIQVLGTEFNVLRHGSGATIAVLEGKVRIGTNTSGTLTAGEEVRVAADGEISARKPADVTRTTAWRQRRLIFDATPLPQIVEEFNRYNRRPQLRIESQEARLRRFTGVFDADDPESLIKLLGQDQRLVTEREGEVLVIR